MSRVWSGQASLEKRLKGITSPRAQKMLGAALLEAGETIATYAQVSITRGAVSGKGHVPSKPGQPPSADTHVLANNIEVTQPEALEVVVSSNAPYSTPLEFGTSKMEARPFFRPARDAKKKEVRAKFAKAVDRIAKGGAD